MKTPTLRMRVLQRAVQIIGNERQLARHLRVPMPELFLWLKGEDEPPQAVFLRAVDLLAEQGGSGTLPPPLADETTSEQAVR